jgi:hypothetical protein
MKTQHITRGECRRDIDNNELIYSLDFNVNLKIEKYNAGVPLHVGKKAAIEKVYNYIQRQHKNINTLFILAEYVANCDTVIVGTILAAVLEDLVFVFEHYYDQRELMRHLHYANYQAINGSGIYNTRCFTID